MLAASAQMHVTSCHSSSGHSWVLTFHKRQTPQAAQESASSLCYLSCICRLECENAPDSDKVDSFKRQKFGSPHLLIKHQLPNQQDFELHSRFLRVVLVGVDTFAFITSNSFLIGKGLVWRGLPHAYRKAHHLLLYATFINSQLCQVSEKFPQSFFSTRKTQPSQVL